MANHPWLHTPESHRKRVATIRRRYGDDFFQRLGHKAGTKAASSRQKAVETTRQRYGDDYYSVAQKRKEEDKRSSYRERREVAQLANQIRKIKKRLASLSKAERAALTALRDQLETERLDDIGADAAIGLRKAARLIVAREILTIWPLCPSDILSKALGIHRRSAQRYQRDILEINRFAHQLRLEVIKWKTWAE